MKRSIALLWLACLFWGGTQLSAQVVLNEVRYNGSDQIELKNLGPGMANVTNWWICHLFSYSQISSLTLVSGNLNMAPGGITVLSGMALNNVNSDLGLYNSPSFASTTAMEDFVQWGTSGQGRESVAAAKGIWVAGDFVPTVSGGTSSMEYDGAGDASTDWFEQSSPTFGAENGILLTCDGGTISATAGGSTLYYCKGVGGGVFAFDSTTTSTDSYTYVVTDAAGIILGLPPGDMVDFTAAPLGECWVWGLSYTGNITAMVGDDATSVALSDGCFDLTDNFITVFRDSVDGGMVMTETGDDSVLVCLGTSASSVIAFDSTAAFGGNFAYVVTDPSGIILGLPPGDMVDFAPAGPGTCLLWGLSYTGNVLAQVGDDATAIALSDGCYDLSDNFVTVIREDTIDGGMVSTDLAEDTVYYCIGGTGGGGGMLSFDSTGTAGSNYAYVITDPSGVILGLPPGDMADFSGAPIGECWIWGLAYTGNVTAQVGDNATTTPLTDACFDLSDNFVVIFRDSVDGGMVMTETGDDSVLVCLGTSASSVIAFDSTAAFGGNFAYVVTDPSGIILGLPPGDMVDFAPAGPGTCLLWGLSYTGNVLAQVGDDATAIALSDGCYDLSDNFVTVIREDNIDGGMVSTDMSEDTVYYCIGGTGGGSGMLNFDSTGTAGSNYAYVVTDPSGVILALPPGDMADFTGAPIGECWIWGLAYTGTVTAQVGDNATTTSLTDACFDLSDNFVVIFRDSVDGGMVSEVGGSDTVYVCLADTMAGSGIVRFESAAAAGQKFAYVVTDPAGIILGIPPANSVDFAPAGVGECWVWGLSYTGELTAQLGDDATAVPLTDGCYDLSDEFVVVYRDSVGPGCSVGIADELALADFSLFPNPATNQVQVSFWQEGGLNTETRVQLYNLQGQLLQEEVSQSQGSGQQELSLSVSALPAGVYLLHVRSGDRHSSTRFLKQ